MEDWISGWPPKFIAERVVKITSAECFFFGGCSARIVRIRWWCRHIKILDGSFRRVLPLTQSPEVKLRPPVELRKGAIRAHAEFIAGSIGRYYADRRGSIRSGVGVRDSCRVDGRLGRGSLGRNYLTLTGLRVRRIIGSNGVIDGRSLLWPAQSSFLWM